MKKLLFYKTLILAWLLPSALLAQFRQEQETRFQNAKTLVERNYQPREGREPGSVRHQLLALIYI